MFRSRALAAIVLGVAWLVVPVDAQVNPALTPHPLPKPALPKIDLNACPFEGCQFGPWRARGAVRMYSTWKPGRTRIGTLRPGESVTAVTGVNVTWAPAVIRVTSAIPDYGLKPGDTVYGYMNLGEGVFNAWFNGYWVQEFEGSGVSAPGGSGCQRNCNATLISAGRNEWWVQVRTKRGRVGWVRGGQQFDGSDALAGRS